MPSTIAICHWRCCLLAKLSSNTPRPTSNLLSRRLSVVSSATSGAADGQATFRGREARTVCLEAVGQSCPDEKYQSKRGCASGEKGEASDAHVRGGTAQFGHGRLGPERR